MANYAVANSTVSGFGSSQAAITTAYKSICITAATTTGPANNAASPARRGKVYDILIGTNTSPADNYLEWQVSRATVSATNPISAGALTSVSSQLTLDPADGQANGFFAVNSSNEGQVSLLAVPAAWYVGINQRASYRWVAAPGSELVYPAVSSATGGNGLCLQARSGAYTGTVTGTVLVSEQ